MLKRFKPTDFLTPKEILEHFPELEIKFNWCPTDIGTMLKCKIIDGYYDRTRRSAYIKMGSLMRLIEYTNTNIEEQKVIFTK